MASLWYVLSVGSPIHGCDFTLHLAANERELQRTTHKNAAQWQKINEDDKIHAAGQEITRRQTELFRSGHAAT